MQQVMRHIFTLFVIIFMGSSVWAENSVDEILTSAEKLFNEKKYEDAIILLDRGLLSELDQHAALFYKRGLAFYYKNDFNNALSSFNQAINSDPYFADAYNGKGYILLQSKGDNDGALVNFNKSIELNPNFGKAYYNRAYVYFLRKEYGNSWNDINVAKMLGYEEEAQFIAEVQDIIGQNDGEYIEYYGNKQMKSKGIFQDGKYEGTRIEYHSNGQIKEKAVYLNGRLHGTKKTYSDDDRLENMLTYELGKQSGIAKIYYPNGNIMYEMNYKNGRLNGVVKFYGETGGLLHEMRYEKGKIVEGSKFYDERGNLLNK